MNKTIADVAERVAISGFKVHLLVGMAASDFFVQYLDRNHLPYKLVSQRVLSKKKSALARYLFFFFSDVVTLFRAIKEINPDLVYCNGSQQIKGVIAATLAHKKVIWHMHDTYQPLPLLLVFKLVRFLCRVKWFLASCERTISFYGLDARYSHISRPCIDTSYFHDPSSTYISNSGNTVKVLTISNVNTDKGLDTLIRVAAEINKSDRFFTFTIAGLGAEDTNSTYVQLRQLMESTGVRNVNFVGQKADIRSMLSKTDLYLCSSRNEGGPTSVFEALAMQVPVVSTDVGDLKKLFTKYNYGPVFPVNDHVALSKELERIVDEPLTLKFRGKAGRKLAEQEADIAICVDFQIRFYARVLST